MKLYQFLTLIMLIMKCTGIISAPWLVVFLPCSIMFGLFVVGCLID